jgi:hypothetical protein
MSPRAKDPDGRHRLVAQVDRSHCAIRNREQSDCDKITLRCELRRTAQASRGMALGLNLRRLRGGWYVRLRSIAGAVA